MSARNAMSTCDKEQVTREAFATLREMVGGCMQCGTCSAGCPNVHAMDVSPRAMWRKVVSGRMEEVLNSKTYALCSSCYTCAVRCPRGISVTEGMSALKRLASACGSREQRKKTGFYRVFVENIRKNGRVRETGLMTEYFMEMMDPMLPLKFAPLGMRMVAAGKIAPWNAVHYKGRNKLAPMFAKVAEMEKQS